MGTNERVNAFKAKYKVNGINNVIPTTKKSALNPVPNIGQLERSRTKSKSKGQSR